MVRVADVPRLVCVSDLADERCVFTGAQHDIFVESNVTQAPATSSQSKRMTRHREERRIF